MDMKTHRDPYTRRNPSSCTRCPYNQTISPCLNCKHTQLSNAGKRWVSIDAFPNPGVLFSREPAIRPPQPTPECVTPLNPDTEDALPKILAEFAELKPDEILLLHGLLRGLSLSEIRDSYFPRITKQAISARLKVSARKFPYFRVLREPSA